MCDNPDEVRSSRKIYERIPVLTAFFFVIVVSMTTVLIVRALLTDFTQLRTNEFASMTYTNIEIDEPNVTYTVSFNSSNSSDHGGYVKKDAVISNISGKDKKPVYVRATVITTIYNSKGENISIKYPEVGAYFENNRQDIIPYSSSSYNWTKRSDGYYYYNRILLPGESTDQLFQNQERTGYNLKISNADQLPNDCTVHIDILADAVQAVSDDSVRWTVKDYFKDSAMSEAIDEVSTAWHCKPSLPKPDAGNSSSLSNILYDNANHSWSDLPSSDVAEFLNGQHTLPCNWSS